MIEAAHRQHQLPHHLSLGVSAWDRRGDLAIEQLVQPRVLAMGLQLRRQLPVAHQLQQLRLGVRLRGRHQHLAAKRMPAPGIEITQRRQPVEPAVGHPLQQFLTVRLLLVAQVGDLARLGGERVRRLAVEQPLQLQAHRRDQLPPHRRGEGFEAGGVEGHGAGNRRPGDQGEKRRRTDLGLKGSQLRAQAAGLP